MAFLPLSLSLLLCGSRRGIVTGSIWQSEITKTTVSRQKTKKYLENHTQNEELGKVIPQSYMWTPMLTSQGMHMDLTLKSNSEKRTVGYTSVVSQINHWALHMEAGMEIALQNLEIKMLIIPSKNPQKGKVVRIFILVPTGLIMCYNRNINILHRISTRPRVSTFYSKCPGCQKNYLPYKEPVTFQLD